MTEKRFKIDEDWGTSLNGLVGVILQDNEIIKVDRVVDLLNALHEENTQLKSSNMEMEDYLARLEEKQKRLYNKIDNQSKDLRKFTQWFNDNMDWDCDRIYEEVFR